MRSISHWGMFESFDKEVRVAYSPEYARQQAAQNANYQAQLTGSAANAFYQSYNFGKLD